ncbi:hypothetical protein [Isoptericola sp. BMS4]|uniref:hypothetical protein n=1 Tax=Isoptericola sp. BMS4 TaxID=2527875 RepID=UPI00141F4CE4|nr:hypothetical protein [Isoptericola sp. BMS4]
MSGDIVMNDELLSRVENDLDRMKERLYEPLDAIRSADPSAVGEPGLVDVVSHFRDRWDRSIDEMCEATGNAREQLQKIRDGFAQIDADLAAALREE